MCHAVMAFYPEPRLLIDIMLLDIWCDVPLKKLTMWMHMAGTGLGLMTHHSMSLVMMRAGCPTVSAICTTKTYVLGLIIIRNMPMATGVNDANYRFGLLTGLGHLSHLDIRSPACGRFCKVSCFCVARNWRIATLSGLHCTSTSRCRRASPLL